MFGRELSVFRRLVPFTYYVPGPVAAVAQRTFEQYPHTFTMALESLEELDTTAYPKMLFAEALQALASGTMEQRKVRELFDAAENAARDETNGDFDRDRWLIDPEYRLWSYEMHLAAGWWARLLRISPRPWEEAEAFVHYRYGSDVRRDGIITKYTDMMLSEKGRNEMNDDINALIERLFILERDLYGEFRLDKRGDQVFMVQSVRFSEVGKNPDTAAGFLSECDVVRRAGNFKVTVEDQQSRWTKYTVRCKPEDDPAAYSELVEVPEMIVARNPNIPRLDHAGRPVAKLEDPAAAEARAARQQQREEEEPYRYQPPAPTASSPEQLAAMMGSQPAGISAVAVPSKGYSPVTQDELVDRGYVRVHFYHHVVPRRNSRDLPYYEFDLAQIRPEVGWAPRKLGEVQGM